MSFALRRAMDAFTCAKSRYAGYDGQVLEALPVYAAELCVRLCRELELPPGELIGFSLRQLEESMRRDRAVAANSIYERG